MWTHTSTCLTLVKYFSISSCSDPNARRDSPLAASISLFKLHRVRIDWNDASAANDIDVTYLSALNTVLMPLPPPPADAFNNTGNSKRQLGKPTAVSPSPHTILYPYLFPKQLSSKYPRIGHHHCIQE